MIEPHDQRDRADDLEIEEGEPAGLAHLLHVLHAGDADHHRAENDRGDHHFDELDKAIAERLHGFARAGQKVTEQDSDNDRGDHLHVE